MTHVSNPIFLTEFSGYAILVEGIKGILYNWWLNFWDLK